MNVGSGCRGGGWFIAKEKGAFDLRDLGVGQFLMVLLIALACLVSLLYKGGSGLGGVKFAADQARCAPGFSLPTAYN